MSIFIKTPSPNKDAFIITTIMHILQTMTRLMELLRETDSDARVDVDVRRFSSVNGIDGLSQPLSVCAAD